MRGDWLIVTINENTNRFTLLVYVERVFILCDFETT